MIRYKFHNVCRFEQWAKTKDIKFNGEKCTFCKFNFRNDCIISWFENLETYLIAV